MHIFHKILCKYLHISNYFCNFAPALLLCARKTSTIMRIELIKQTLLATVLSAAAFFVAAPYPVYAQELAELDEAEAIEMVADTLVADVDSILVEPDPEWYVAPVEPVFGNSPRRALAAASCPTDSVVTYDVDGNFAEVTCYYYDEAGNTIRTEAWTYSEGKRIGTTKQEFEFNAGGVQIMTAAYTWDNTTNNWKGTEKTEDVFNSSNKMESRTISDWVNGAWLPKTKYTYAYDASDREIEYITYARGANNELVKSKGRFREYNDKGKMTLEIQYTAFANDAWTAGTKKMYDFDASGNQIEYTYYSAYANGTWGGSSSTHEVWTYTSGKKTYYEKQTWSNGWVNSSKETWTYNSAGKQTYYEKNVWSNGAWIGSAKELWEFNAKNSQTLHEKYGWANSDWAISQKDSTAYDASNRSILVENYTYANGVQKGSKKEEYTYKGTTTKKTSTIKYKWSNSAWAYNTKAVNDYDAAGNTTETANYSWKNDAWVGSGNRVLKTFDSKKNPIEQINQAWSTEIGNWVNVSRTTAEYSGSTKTQEASYTWQNGAWLGTSRSDWHYNAAGKNDTVKTYTNNGTEWIYSARTVNTYNAAGENIMTHASQWDGSKWVLVSMTRKDIILDAAGNQLLSASWKCGSDSVWIGVSKDTAAYNAAGDMTYRAVYTSWANNDWVPSYKIETTYDDAGNVTFTQRMDWESGAWKGHYRYENVYDAFGRITSSAVFNNWNTTTNNWEGTLKTETEYNSAGQILTVLNYTWKDNDWRESDYTMFTYDAAGNVIDQVVQNYSNGTWVNSLRYEKEYQGGQQIKSNDYTWVNGAWQFTRRSEKTYDNDAQAKLRREISGVWTNGVVVTFTDDHYYYNCDQHLYTITWMNDDNTQIDQTQVESGVVPTHADATKENTAEWTYTFTGWDVTPVAATGDATYTATFSQTKNKYTITFANEDGSTIEAKEYEYGATPVAPSDPTKPATAQYTYTFAGWDKEIVSVTGEATYKATFTSTVNKYTITFANEDGSTIEAKEYEYGATPVAPSDPTKLATAQYTYTFAGWDKEIATVTGEATYKATFTATVNKYTITFANEDGTTIEAKEYEYGATPVAPSDPTKPATAQYTYTFAGWDKEIATVTGAATYTATFTSTIRTYTITWVDGDGNTIQTEQVAYGETPVYTGETPTKTATTEATYEFNNTWSPAIEPVTGDATYTALFTESGIHPSTVIITYVDDEGNVLFYEQYTYGQTPDPATPGKESTAQYDYTFTGWSPAIAPATSDATYQATFTATVRSYTITFVNEDGTVLYSEVLEYGQMPEYVGETPTKAEDKDYTYSFSGWTPEISMVVGKATYTATYTATEKVETGIAGIDSGAPATKVMEKGILYIIRAGQKYTTTGAPVR